MTSLERKTKRQQKRFQKRRDKARLKASKVKFKNEIYMIEHEDFKEPEWKERWTTSKKLMYLLIINCTVVEIYSMAAMIYLKDLSALSVLISTVIGESISYGIYCLKSYFSKKSEERLKFEREQGEDDESNDDVYLENEGSEV